MYETQRTMCIAYQLKIQEDSIIRMLDMYTDNKFRSICSRMYIWIP